MRKGSTRMLALVLSAVMAVSSFTGFGGEIKVSASENPVAVVAGAEEATPTDPAVDASKYGITLGKTSYVYDGAAKKPTVKIVGKNGKALKPNVDYTVSYKNNILPGTAYVSVRYKGEYTGTAKKAFKISQAAIGNVKTKSGSSSIKLSWGKVSGVTRYVIRQYKDGKWKSVYAGAALTNTVKNLSAITTYKFQITGQRKLNSGKYVDVAKSAVVTAKTGQISVSGFSVTLGKKSFIYDGTAKKPTVNVTGKVGGKSVTLTNGTDYTCTYLNNVYPGTATVKITFKGKYTGTKNVTYKITTADISKISSTQTTSSITFKWNPVKGATQYRIYTCGSGKTKEVARVSNTSVTIKNLKANKEYKFIIKAYTSNAGKAVLAGRSSAFVDQTSLPKVTVVASGTVDKKDKNLVVDASGSDWVYISWKRVIGASGYYIYRYDEKGKKWIKYADTSKISYGLVDKKVICRLEGLKPGTGYCFKIAAYKTNVETMNNNKTFIGDMSDTLKVATTIKAKYGWDDCNIFQEVSAQNTSKKSRFFRVELSGCSSNKGYYITVNKIVNGKITTYKRIKTNKSTVDIVVPDNSIKASYYLTIMPYITYGGKTFASGETYNIPQYGNLKTKIFKLSGISKIDSKTHYYYDVYKDKKGNIKEYMIRIEQYKLVGKNRYAVDVFIYKHYNAKGKYVGMDKYVESKKTTYVYDAKGKLVEYSKYIYADDGVTTKGIAVYDGNGKLKRKTTW